MYNIGMIGTGFITEDFIASTKQIDKANAYGICSRSSETANAFKTKHDLSVAYTNFDAMLADSNIDIIYIASPNALHFEQAKKSIESGKHVLVEKPMALLPAEITELYTLAKENNVYIQEAYVSLTYNTFKQVASWIETLGEIGKVDLHLDQQTRHFQAYIEGENFNVFNGKMGGGALRDLGPYVLYPLISWFGEPMQSHYFSTKNELEADETTLVLCHFETFSSTIHVSKMLSDKRPNIISGDNGYIEIDHINEMKSVKLFTPTGELVSEVNCDYTNRMIPQLNHYLEILESGKFESDIYTCELALMVHSIISENYK